MKKKIHDASLMTAIKTPYKSGGEIDLDCYDELVTEQMRNGVEGLIVCGTTGEGHLMDWEEHLMLIAHSVNRFGDELVIVGNTGSNNTREALKATRYGFAFGMDASLQINPYYGKTSEKGLREHFKRLLDLGPAIIYNVSSRTGQDLQPELIESLAEHSNPSASKSVQETKEWVTTNLRGLPAGPEMMTNALKAVTEINPMESFPLLPTCYQG